MGKNRRTPLAVLLLLMALSPGLVAEMRVTNFTTTTGLRVKIIQDLEMSYIHSQLIIFCDEGSASQYPPPVPYFMLYDIFEEEWQRSSTELSGHLQRMGDDFDYHLTPEYLRISVNFLSDKGPTFASFLKELFTYNSFSLKRFARIKNNFWSIFRRQREWKKEMAFQVAYSNLFGEPPLGRKLVTASQVRTVNLAQVNAYYRKNVRPDRALLVIRGNVNPYQMFGVIERQMNFSFNRAPFARSGEKAAVNTSRRIFLVPDRESEGPTVYFFDVAPAFDNPQFLSFYIVDFSLFHYPFGRAYNPRAAISSPTRGYPLVNEMVNHRDLSVLCSYAAVAAPDIENFIQLLDQEKRRLGTQPIQREEFSNALNYLLGKTRVESSNCETEVEIEIGRAIAENRPIYLAPTPDVLQRVSIDSLEAVVDDFFSYSQRSGVRERGVIVIVGNEEQVMAHWKGSKPEVIRYLE